MNMQRSTLLACTALIATSMAGANGALAQSDMPGEGTSVQMARATWDTGWFQAEIYRQALEALGYDVGEPLTLDNPPFYQSVAQGDVDLWVNGWFPLHNSYEETFSDGAELVGYVAEGGALQGYLIDKATYDEHGITNLGDLTDPENAELFDSDGDGKAELVACPPGWGCEVVISHHMEAYGLSDTVSPIKASYSASMADAVGRYENGESILFYTWTPNWTVGILKPNEDVVWIGVPESNLPEDQKDLEDETVVEDLEGCVADPCNLGFPANDIRPVANTEFLEENPAVRALLETASIPLEDIFAQNAQMNEGADSPAELQQQAEQWIADNQSTFDGWLEEARAAAQ